jgi:hypothetical protein
MSKVITIRLTGEEYGIIHRAAADERRPMSNFITTRVLRDIEEDHYTDTMETAQILGDKKLIAKLKRGHREAGKRLGRMIG